MSPEVDQDPGVSLRRKIAQDLSELAWGEFARSTRAAHHLGEPLLSKQGHPCIMPRFAREGARLGRDCLPEAGFAGFSPRELPSAKRPAAWSPPSVVR